MAYFTFTNTGTDKGAPVLAPVNDHWMPGPGAIAPWFISGQTGHRQPHVSSAAATTPTILTATPSVQIKPTGEVKADGNYKTFHNRGGRGLVSPPTR